VCSVMKKMWMLCYVYDWHLLLYKRDSLSLRFSFSLSLSVSLSLSLSLMPCDMTLCNTVYRVAILHNVARCDVMYCEIM
jgi:hypothetical protein